MAKSNKKKRIVTKKHLARKQREEKQKKIIILVTIIVGAIVVGLVGYGVVDQLIIRPKKPVATVGNTVITTGDFESRVKYTRVQMLNQAYQYFTFYQQFGEMGASFQQNAQSLVSQLKQPVVLGSQVLDEMVNDVLIREEAAKRNITVSEEEIDEAMQAAFNFYPDGTATPTTTSTPFSTPTLSETQYALVSPTFTPTITEMVTGTPEVSPTIGEGETTGAEAQPEGEENTAEESAGDTEAAPENDPTITLTPTITSTPTPYTTQVYGENIKDFNDNYSFYDFDIDDLREMFEVQLLREKLVDELTTDLEPVKVEVWARHILVETESQALEVLEKLDEGEDWSTLASEYSIDESNKEAGGDLGWFDENTMVAPFSEKAFSMDIGEISDPVETDFGFHIIQVLGHRELPMDPNEFQTLKNETFTTWLNELRNSRDDITIFDSWEEDVPTVPEVPQQFLTQLYQAQPTQGMPQIVPPEDTTP